VPGLDIMVTVRFHSPLPMESYKKLIVDGISKWKAILLCLQEYASCSWNYTKWHFALLWGAIVDFNRLVLILP